MTIFWKISKGRKTSVINMKLYDDPNVSFRYLKISFFEGRPGRERLENSTALFLVNVYLNPTMIRYL